MEVVRHILRDTLHATSVRNELSEVGELLEDVVADFGASIRLRDSAGIAEGRDALMEAVNILGRDRHELRRGARRVHHGPSNVTG